MILSADDTNELGLLVAQVSAPLSVHRSINACIALMAAPSFSTRVSPSAASGHDADLQRGTPRTDPRRAFETGFVGRIPLNPPYIDGLRAAVHCMCNLFCGKPRSAICRRRR